MPTLIETRNSGLAEGRITNNHSGIRCIDIPSASAPEIIATQLAEKLVINGTGPKVRDATREFIAANQAHTQVVTFLEFETEYALPVLNVHLVLDTPLLDHPDPGIDPDALMSHCLATHDRFAAALSGECHSRLQLYDPTRFPTISAYLSALPRLYTTHSHGRVIICARLNGHKPE